VFCAHPRGLRLLQQEGRGEGQSLFGRSGREQRVGQEGQVLRHMEVEGLLGEVRQTEVRRNAGRTGPQPALHLHEEPGRDVQTIPAQLRQVSFPRLAYCPHCCHRSPPPLSGPLLRLQILSPKTSASETQPIAGTARSRTAETQTPARLIRPNQLNSNQRQIQRQFCGLLNKTKVK